MPKTRIILCTIYCVFLQSCATSTDPRYFDYSGSDGCSPPNIGHRLGGDLDQYSDNTIEGMRGIESQQSSSCFKNWEFDLTQSADELVLMSYLEHNGIPVAEQSLISLPPGVVVASQLVSEFSEVVATKPIVIDLKGIRTLQALKEAKSVADQLSRIQEVDIWFIASKESTRNMPDVCSVLGADFDLLLYSQGGAYCGSIF